MQSFGLDHKKDVNNVIKYNKKYFVIANKIKLILQFYFKCNIFLHIKL